MKTDNDQIVTVESYELSHSYLGNKPQHRGCDDDDRYSGEYRVAILTMSDGSTQYGMWCDGHLYDDDYFPTEEEASDALEAEWEENKDELEAEHRDDNDDDDDEDDENEEPSLRHTACFADIQNESIRQQRMLEASA